MKKKSSKIKLAKGLKHQLGDDNTPIYNNTFSLKKLEEFILDRLTKIKPDWERPPHKMSYEEAQGLFGNQISREEYENSTGLFYIHGSITGLGGWNIYINALHNCAKNEIKKIKD